MSTPTGFTAKNKEHYINAWRNHVKELSGLYLAASKPGTFSEYAERWEVMRTELYNLIDVAAENQNWENKS